MQNRFVRLIGIATAAVLVAAALLPRDSVAGPTPTAKPANVTFNRDVAPILYANCVSCHHSGEVGPFPLVTYQDACKHADLIADVTKSKQMPPWKAQSGYGHFMNERHLTDEQIATLAAWNSGGMPEGNAGDLPAAPQFTDGGWQLGKPDLVVKVPEPFTVPASGRDVFRCFIVPLNIDRDQYVTAVEFRPSNRAVVHHALLFLDSRGQAQAVQKQWTTDHPEDLQLGYNHFGGPGFTPSGGLGGWAPGATPSFLPEGVARTMPAKSDLVIQTHFHPTGKPEVEQSSVAIYFARKPPTQVLAPMLLGSRKIDIPAGEKNYVVTDELITPCDLSIIGITPHAHLICRGMDVWATLPPASGTTVSVEKVPLIKIDDWDFNWQGQYRYAEPVKLPRGTTLHMRYVYDNSADNERNPNAPPKEILHGEQTTNEMAFCFLEVVPDKASDQLALRRARIQHLLAIRFSG